MTAYRIETCSGVALDPDACEPFRAVIKNVRDVGKCLHIIDNRWTLVEANYCREGRLEAGMAPFPLQRFQKRRFLTADVGPRASMDEQIKVVTGSQDVFPQ